MLRSLKNFVARCLCNSVTGSILLTVFRGVIPCWRYGKVRIRCSYPFVRKDLAAGIFFGAYEGSEIRLAQRYVDNRYPIVELGGSLGVLSCHLGLILNTERDLIVVEANPEISTALKANLERNGIHRFQIDNCGIGQTHTPLYFDKGNSHITGFLTDCPRENCLTIPIKSLSQICRDHSLDHYVLVCDIEGSELDILLYDREALTGCELMIIETHATTRNGRHYESESIAQMIEDCGFERLEQQGVSYVFKRRLIHAHSGRESGANVTTT